jgi:hypothetical protein
MHNCAPSGADFDVGGEHLLSLGRINSCSEPRAAAQQPPPLRGLYTDEPSRLSYPVVVYNLLLQRKPLRLLLKASADG